MGPMNVKIMHNSHSAQYKKPFGAVACGQPIRLRLDIAADQCIRSVEVHIISKETETQIVPMLFEETREEKSVYVLNILASDAPGLMWYFFKVDIDGTIYYYGNNQFNYGGFGEIYGAIPPAYQITVFQGDVSIPKWFCDRIMYQIFTDRFYNGNENGQIKNAKKNSFIYANWQDKPCYIKDCESGNILRWDFFGGNLEGIIKKLSYLSALGIDVIYLNPIFEAPSNHKYDTGDYKKIDPMFGDNGLFERLCTEAKAMGIEIILDGVFSHTGCDSIYFNKYGTYPEPGAYQSEASPYDAWFRFGENHDSYDCWWGIKSLPNVNEMEPGYLDYIIRDENSVLKQWMALGAKGWRLDVADELPDEFIQLYRKTMKEVDPEAILIGEVWEDASNKMSYGKRRAYLMGNELDSVMNYPFRDILLNLLLGRQSVWQAHMAMYSQFENYPMHHFYCNMNLVGSHDVPRALTILGEAPSENTMSLEMKDKYDLPPQQRELGIARLKLLALIQLTFPGVPCIYYGDEAGVEGFKDPLNRATYPWGKEEQALLGWYKKLIALRKQYDVLRTGQWIPMYISEDIYGYLRVIQGGKDVFGQDRSDNMAVILVNRSRYNRAETIIDLSPWCQSEYLVDLLGSDAQMPLQEGMLKISLEPLEGKILVNTKE